MNYLKYLLSIWRHKWFVFLGGLKAGVPIWRLILHDFSKFSSVEFFAYAKKWQGGEYTKEEWKLARNHHFSTNDHHPEYWIHHLSPRPMPEVCVREMVADWLGFERGYKGTWNIQPWLDSLAYRPVLHIETIKILEKVLSELGFTWPK